MTAGADVAPVHDRQPAILEPAQIGAWLASASDEAGLAPLEPSPGGTIEALPVSPRANSVANDDPECLAPAARPRTRSRRDSARALGVAGWSGALVVSIAYRRHR